MHEKPASEPLDQADLRRWPWGIGRVELREGLAFVSARHRGGFTTDDLDAVPDDGRRYELLDGVVVVSPSPSRPHQRVVARLTAILLAAEVGGMHTLPAPCDVDLGSRRRLQPDLLVLPFPDAATPVLVVEVLSRTGREYDQVGKRRVYQEAGIPSYWLLDPDRPSATVLELDGDGRYQEVARAVGEDECTLQRPFPVRFRPAALLR